MSYAQFSGVIIGQFLAEVRSFTPKNRCLPLNFNTEFEISLF